MSYHVYQTEGIILGSAPIGESNRYYYLMTKDLGFLIAFAQGVREVRSKLRPQLSDFSHVSLDLIRGRDAWRIVNADIKETRGSFLSGVERMMLLARLSLLARRLLHGEERNEELFETLRGGFSYADSTNTSRLNDIEVFLAAKIVKSLGYWGGDEKMSALIEEPIGDAALNKIPPVRRFISKEVNRALSESHL
ncbi:MAG: recombination protein O N-terminal domain-containing protein [Patescibacteria group bacterium]